MINWQIEIPLIQAEATKRCLDHQFLRAIRNTENGGDGKQFGVLEAGVTTYAEQLEVCAATVAHRLETYPVNPLTRVYGANGTSRIIYSPSFIAYFSSIWAPLNVANDPQGLNRNWLNNAIAAYHTFVQEELSGK